MDTLAASQALRRLRDAGLLEQKGRGAGTYYLPTPWLLGQTGETPDDVGGDAASDDQATSTTRLAGLSSNPATLSSNPATLSSNPGGLSSNPGGLSSNLGALSRNPHWQSLPPELRDMVAALGQRASPDRLREALIRLCRHRSWQAAELAGLFNRNPDYLGTPQTPPFPA